MDSRLKRLEFLLNGATIVTGSDSAASCDRPRLYHCLIPSDLPNYLSEDDLSRSTFECELSLDFEPSFLRSRHGGHYRVLIYEVEWFNYEEPIANLALRLTSADLAQIPGVRVKPPIIFH